MHVLLKSLWSQLLDSSSRKIHQLYEARFLDLLLHIFRHISTLIVGLVTDKIRDDEKRNVETSKCFMISQADLMKINYDRYIAKSK